MKIKFIFILLILFPYICYSQTPDTTEWSPEGATWIYKRFSPTSQSYLEISYIKDTFVSGIQTKQFLERHIVFTGPNLQVRTVYDIGKIYLYNSNDSIYFYNNGKFEFIYNYSPAINDEFILNKNFKSYCNTAGYPDYDTITVTNIKKDTLSNLIFDIIEVNDYYKKYKIGDIIKNIGPIYSFYPLVNVNDCQAFAGGLSEGLVCYKDNIRGKIEINSGTFHVDCHTISTVINESSKEEASKIFIYPNPVKNNLYLNNISEVYLDKLTYEVYDITGKRVLSGNRIMNSIDVSALEKGVYIINLSLNEYSQKQKFVKQ